MQPQSSWSGTIIEDPALSMPKGSLLHFESIFVKGESSNKLNYLPSPEVFDGILLQIHFKSNIGQTIEGSAVIVAPGIAVCARHVISPYVNDIKSGLMDTICSCIASYGLQLWRITHVSEMENTDYAILSMKLVSKLPPKNVFKRASISTRMPKVGEKLFIAGFKPEPSAVDPNSGSIGAGNVVACFGEVTARFPEKRDTVRLPWPSLEVDCPAFGGMSGGPAFDSSGRLIGILASSFDTESGIGSGPSYISLIWPVLTRKFPGGWPISLFNSTRSLVELDRGVCAIDKPEAVSSSVGADGVEYHTYTVWE